MRLLAPRASVLSWRMDFAMSAKAHDYHKRLSDFMMDSSSRPRPTTTATAHEAGPKDHTVAAGRRGTENHGQRARPVEPVPARRVGPDQPGLRAAGRVDRLEPGDRARGDQLCRP